MSVNLPDILRFFLIITLELALLFVLISFLIGLLQQYVPAERIRKVLGGNRPPFVNNALGALFGALTPFCSCSTIPITLGLLTSGAPFSAAMSFLIASPLLNPVIISLLLALLGIRITVIYFTIVFAAAVLTGYVWDRLGLAAEVKGVTKQTCCCAATATENLDIDTRKVKIANAASGAWGLFKQMLSWLIIGAGIGALIYGFIPQELVIKIAGPDNFLAIPVAAIIGAPMYIRTETILPISKVLLSKGMSIGAVMALIIGGSGASIPEISLLAAIFKRKLLIAFIISILFWSICAGILFQFLS